MRYGMLTFDPPEPDVSRKILHVDMDAFYASIEIRDQPKLKHLPVVIARHPKQTNGRGVVTTCNYVARTYGIHSAMPAIEAYKLCPHAVFVPGRMDYYREVSQQIRQIFREYTDLIEPLSLDEAYLDVTDNHYQMPSATLIAQQIQQEIEQKLQLTCSIGVSYNKFIAKLASDYQKPRGLTVVTPDEALDFLLAMPIDDFYGVGKKSLPALHELGIYTGRDLYSFELETLMDHFGKMGQSLYYHVRGIDNSPVQATRQRKSIGKERTFRQFIEYEVTILQALHELTEQVINRLNQQQLRATVVTIKVRYADFTTLTRQQQLNRPIQTVAACYQVVEELWRQEFGDLDQPVRLLGVTVSGFDQATVDYLPLELD